MIYSFNNQNTKQNYWDVGDTHHDVDLGDKNTKIQLPPQTIIIFVNSHLTTMAIEHISIRCHLLFIPRTDSG